MLDPISAAEAHICSIDMTIDKGLATWFYANDDTPFCFARLEDISSVAVEHDMGDNMFHRTLVVNIVGAGQHRIKYRDNKPAGVVKPIAFEDLKELLEAIAALG